MKTKTIYITEKINFKMMLSLRVMKETEMLNGVRYLEERKHNFITKKCGYGIEGSHIIFLNIEPTEIQSLINIVNW